ncbi:MAG: glycosyltransferase family 4 protein [Vicingus serpentipes]|nr:glycosyltransferase family 4 protein [Vicingus serpentipes]
MKVLQICSKPPRPLTDGGCKAMDAITQGLLNQGVGVKLLTISTAKHPFDSQVFSDDYLQKTAIESVFVDTKVKPLAAFYHLFNSSSYNVTRFYDAEFEKKVEDTLKQEQYDVVFIEGLYVTPYITVIRANTKAKIIYRAHNVEFEIWEMKVAEIKSVFKRNYIKGLARKLKKYEQSILNKVDGIVAITNRDKEQLLSLGAHQPIEVIPFGIDIEAYQSAPIEHNNSLFYIGSMDWEPNQEAIKWFLKEVWNKVVDQFPVAKFYLAGKRMPQWLLNIKQQNLIVLGEVESAVDFINHHEIMVVPLFSGSGMRIKIIEGMALGKVVIATTIAAEGIAYTVNENILIADTPDEFVLAINNCLTDQSLVKKIGDNAKRMVVTNYDNQVIVNNLVQFFKHIIG